MVEKWLRRTLAQTESVSPGVTTSGGQAACYRWL